VGLPGLNGFVSEFYCLIGTFIASPDARTYPGVLGPWYAAFAASGMIFAAMYLLMMTGKVVWGPLKEPRVTSHGHGHAHAHGEHGGHAVLPPDLNVREIAVLAPLAVLCVVIGFQPSCLTDTMEKPIENALSAYPAQVGEARRIVQDPPRDVNANATVQVTHPSDGRIVEGGRSDG
jgi:NADH-quinone oxidoreductase subunit M